MRIEPKQPSHPVKRADAATKPDGNARRPKHEAEELSPAPLPEDQREIAGQWIRPPGQSSG